MRGSQFSKFQASSIAPVTPIATFLKRGYSSKKQNVAIVPKNNVIGPFGL